MPNVAGKEYPYTKSGMAAAKKAAMKMKKKPVMKKKAGMKMMKRGK